VPGDHFKVSIPAPEVEDESDGNKFTREFQELAAQYATKWDLWCHAESEYHQADPEQKGKYPLKAKKIAKFDDMIQAFPSNLLTPVDAAYMKKIVRRARQNKKKRKEAVEDNDILATTVPSKPAPAKPDAKPSPKPLPKPKPAMKLDVKSMPKAPKQKLLKAVKPVMQTESEVSKTIEIVLPSKGRVFTQQKLRHDEFDGMTAKE